MKKLVTIFLCLVMCFSFVGCDNNVKQNSKINTSSVTFEEAHSNDNHFGNDLTSPNTQNTISSDEQEENNELSLFLQSREGYQQGTNCDLQGNIKVHLFFVDDQESQWDKETVEQFTNKQILPGLNFLEEEAKYYGVALDFSVQSHTTGFKTGNPIRYNGKISKIANHTLDIFDNIAAQFGFESSGEMYAELYGQNNCSEVIFLSIVNKDGISYALKQCDGDFYNPILEFGVVFKNDFNKNFDIDENTHAAVSVAHEILHVYGAVDMYTPIETKEMLESVYPRDIMLLNYSNIDDLVVGDYTAYSVGWKNQAPINKS